MARSVCLVCAAAAAALLLAGNARAEDPPDLVGTWKGTAYAVHIGSNPYRVAEKAGPNFPDNGIEFTYTITEQHGNRFGGSMSGGKYSETLIGAIGPDNKSGVMLDDDGEYSLTIRDADTLDTCYRHSFPTSRVVACWQLKRVKG
ncbi:MAG: hypothetical protein AB7I59_29285 [Geminicoccaceae bacterium]